MKESARIFRFAVIGTLNALIIGCYRLGNDGRTGHQLYALQCNRIYTCTDTQLHLVQVLDIPYRKKEQHLATSAALFYSFRNGLRSAIPFPHRLVEGLDCNEYLAQFLDYSSTEVSIS